MSRKHRLRLTALRSLRRRGLLSRSPVAPIADRAAAGPRRSHFEQAISSIVEHGAGIGLPVLGEILAGDCPKAKAAGIHDRCGVNFPQLPELFMRR